MADVQKENGFCPIATEIIEKLCSYQLSGEEWQVLLCVWRKTYCWHKKEDYISLSQFAVLSGLKRPTVVRVIKKLVAKKLLTVIKKDNSYVNLYRFNKDFDQWTPLSKKIMVLSKKIRGVIKKDNGVLSKKIHTIDTITIDTITKDNKQPAEAGRGDVNKIFDIFYKINPTLNYGNLSQRKTVEELLAKFGEERLLKTVEYAISIQGEKFSPVITTPLQLKLKLGELMVFWKKNNNNGKTNIATI